MKETMLELLRTRRSVRAYKPDQVKAEELDAVLEAGTWAPTGQGKQSPVIVAVQDPKYRQAVMELNKKARGGPGGLFFLRFSLGGGAAAPGQLGGVGELRGASPALGHPKAASPCGGRAPALPGGRGLGGPPRPGLGAWFLWGWGAAGPPAV